MKHTDLGKELMSKIIEETKDVAKVESQPKFEGKQMVMIIQPIWINHNSDLLRIVNAYISPELFMPKLKTKSSAKKRFRITAKGKVKMPQANKRHGMIKRTNNQIRKQRGTTIMTKQDSKIVKSYMPYNLRG